MIDIFFNKYIRENGLKLDKKERGNTSEKLVTFFKENQYVFFDEKAILNDSLTQIGIEAKKAGGHFKYVESLKPKKEYWFSKYQVISLSLVIISISFSAYKYFDSKELKSQYETLKSEQKTLESDFDSLKSKYDSVTKQTTELPKQNTNDSLRTKNVFE